MRRGHSAGQLGFVERHDLRILRRQRREDETEIPALPCDRLDHADVVRRLHHDMDAAQGPMRCPWLVVLDEPYAGFSLVLVDRVPGMVSERRAKGTSLLLVEQLIEKALAVSDRLYTLAQGQIVLRAGAKEDDLPHRLELAYFGEHVPTALHA